MRSAVSLIACVIVVASSAPVTDAEIYSAAPLHVSPGTWLDVNGGGFGAHPTAAFVTDTRRVPLKFWSVSEDGTRLHARLVNVPAGVAGEAILEIQPRGVQLPSDFPGFTIEKPQIRAVGPEAGVKNTIVTIRGSFFGVGARDDLRPGGGTVRFGAKPAAVLSWNDGEIRVKAPKLKDGPYDVTVTNRAGSSTKTGAFVAGSAVPDDSQVRGTFGDASFEAFGSAQINSNFMPGQGTTGEVSVFCIVRGADVSKYFWLTAKFDPTKPFPQTLYANSVRSVAFSSGPTDGVETDDYQTSMGGNASVTIDRYEDVPFGIFLGSFHGTLDQFGSAGGMGPTITCDGTFWVRVGR